MGILNKLKGKLAISMIIGAIVFLGLSVYANFGEIMGAFAKFLWFYIPLLLILTLINYFIRFLKWHFFVKQLKIDVDWRQSFVVFFGGLIMTVSPGKLGEVFKSFLLKQLNNTPLSVSAPIVLAERLTDVLALIVLALYGALSFKYGLNFIYISIIVIVIGILIMSSRKIAIPLIDSFQRVPLLRKYVYSFHNLYESIYTLIRFRSLFLTTFLGVISWFFECIGFYLVIKGFGEFVTLQNATFIYAFSTLAGAFTMMPGGIGLTEVSLTGLLIHAPKYMAGQDAITKATASASTIIIRLVTLWFAVFLGAFVLMLNKKMFDIPEDFELEDLKEK
ncbi:flippase-like domain-containing protein [bacterium]|nr:flippase-like domain-containing protein [bacterium]